VAAAGSWARAYAAWFSGYDDEPEDGWGEADLEAAFRAGWEAREGTAP
jgi:hypothetical protein